VERAITGFYSRTPDLSVAAIRDEGGRVSKTPTQAEINNALYGKKRRSKYNVDHSPEGLLKRTYDGIVFDSEHEKDVYLYLKSLEKAGTISHLERQVEFPLNTISAETGLPVRVCSWTADFVAKDSSGQRVVFDAKGFKTKEYRRTKRWFELQHGTRITEL
jgi:hypothetical protein